MVIVDYRYAIKKRLNIMSTLSVDVSGYLTEVEQIVGPWKEGSIVERIKVIIGLSRSVVDFYSEVLDEPTQDDQIRTLTDVVLIVWGYAKDKLGVKLPIWLTPLFKPAVEWVVRRIFEAAVTYFVQDKDNATE